MAADPGNPPIVGIRRARIQCDVTRGTAFGLTEFHTGRQPRITAGNALSLQLLFVGIPQPGQQPEVADLSGASLIVAVVKPSQTAGTPVYALQTRVAGAITPLPDYDDWEAGTAQHVSFDFTSGEINAIAVEGESTDVWLAVTAIIDGEERTLAAGKITVEQDNNDVDVDPDDPVPPVVLATQWFVDDGAPDGELGIVNDLYLDALTGDVYQKTGVTTWVVVANIKGPASSGGGGGQAVPDPTGQAASKAIVTDGADGYTLSDPLGDAATKNTGSTAGTLAAGDDARLSDARPPTAHASTHASAGSDPLTPADIGAEVAGAAATVAGDLSTHEGLTTTAHGGIVASDDSRLTDARTPTAHAASHTNGTDDIQDATASAKGLATAAQITKLDGIEAGANAYVLPTPTTTVIGGVKRNVGSAGQFVSGVSPDGDLEYGSPSGSGDVVGPASATDGATALFDGTTGKLLKDGVVLGDSATRDVGTAAGTVAAGDAAPNAHASTHASAGSDPITPADIGAATSAQGDLADSAVQPGDLSTVATSGDYDDLTNKPALGDSAALDVGTTAGTVAAGDDSRIVGAVQTTREVATTDSIQGGGDLSADRTLSLVGDTASPGNNKVYGTDGSGVRGWKDDPSGGAGGEWVPLGVFEATSSASLTADNIFDAAEYDHYRLRLEILPATNNVGLVMRLRDGTPADAVTIRRCGAAFVRLDSAGQGTTSAAGVLTGDVGNGADRTLSADIVLHMPGGKPHHGTADMHYVARDTNGTYVFRYGFDFNDTTPRQGIKFDFSSGNVASGRLEIWGIKKQPDPV
jgi:hypothetical protein